MSSREIAASSLFSISFNSPVILEVSRSSRDMVCSSSIFAIVPASSIKDVSISSSEIVSDISCDDAVSVSFIGSSVSISSKDILLSI